MVFYWPGKGGGELLRLRLTDGTLKQEKLRNLELIDSNDRYTTGEDSKIFDALFPDSGKDPAERGIVVKKILVEDILKRKQASP